MANDNKITDLTGGIYRRQFSGFIRGQRINSMSLSAEAWFWRFHAAADDFGNAPADPELAFAETVGRRKGITPDQVQAWLEECAAAKLVRLYEVSGEKFYHVADWSRRQGAGKNGKRVRHYPPSPYDAHLNGRDGSGFIPVNPDASSASESQSESDSHSQSEYPQPPAGDGGCSQAAREAEARSYARQWCSAEAPNFLRSACLGSFERLILRLGKRQAVEAIQSLRGERPDVGNPFRYLEQKLDNEKLTANESPEAQAKRVIARLAAKAGT